MTSDPAPAATRGALGAGRSPVLVLSAIGLLCFAGVGAALPVLPLYLTRTLDTSGL